MVAPPNSNSASRSTRSSTSQQAVNTFSCCNCDQSIDNEFYHRCKTCSKPFHAVEGHGCGVMTVVLFQSLKTYHLPGMLLVCSSCESRLENIFNRMDALDEKIRGLEERLTSAPSADVDMRISNLEGQLNTLNNSMPNLIANAMSEIEEKKEKRNNLVLVGITEAQEDLKKWVEAVGSEIDNSVDWKTAIKGAQRNGKNPIDRKTGKELPRIIKLFFNDKDARKVFLQKYKSYALGTEDFTSSFCRIDMTYNERQKDKELRAQVRLLADNGDKSWVVRDFKIVRKTNRSGLTTNQGVSDR